MFIQEKLLNLIKQGLWHCNLNCSHLLLLRSAVALKTSNFENIVQLVKTSCLATIGWGRPCLELLKKVLFSEHCPYLTCLAAHCKSPNHRALLSLGPDWSTELALQKKPCPQGLCQKQSVAIV